MITGIEHVGIMSKDTRALAAWYEEKLAFSIVFVSDETAAVPIIFLKKGDGALIELFGWKEGFDGPQDDSLRQTMHICIYTDDFKTDLTVLKENGVQIQGDPFQILGGADVCFIRDLDGNWLHLVQRPSIPWS